MSIHQEDISIHQQDIPSTKKIVITITKILPSKLRKRLFNVMKKPTIQTNNVCPEGIPAPGYDGQSHSQINEPEYPTTRNNQKPYNRNTFQKQKRKPDQLTITICGPNTWWGAGQKDPSSKRIPALQDPSIHQPMEGV